MEIDGQFSTVDISPYLGQPEAWRTWLTQRMGVARGAVTGGMPLVCGLDGCAP